MNLKDIIEQINGRVVRSILQENGLPVQENSQEEEAQTLVLHLLDEAMVAKQAKKLTDSEKTVLSYFVFGVGHDIVTYRQLETWARTAPYSIMSGLTALRRKGLIYTLRRLWGELAYSMPYDLQRVWRTYLLAKDDSRMSIEGLEQSSPSVPLSEVVFSLLQAHRTQPVSLTKRGLPGVRLRREWLDIVPYGQEAFHVFYPAGQEDGTAIFFFFLTLLKEMQLLIPGQQRQEELVVHHEACVGLFAGDVRQVQANLYQPVRKMIEQLNPLYPVLFEWVERHAGEWVSLDAVCRNWANRIPYIGRAPESVGERKEAVMEAGRKFAEEAVPLLCAFGFFASATNQSGGMLLAYRQTIQADRSLSQSENENSGQTGYVQPTFEVLLLPHAPYEIRWEAGAFSHLANRQEVWTFVINRRSIESFIENSGGKAEDIYNTLAAIHGGEIPGNVSGQIRDWARSTRAAAWEQVVWLACPDQETADQLGCDPVLSPLIKSRIGGQEFLVNSSAVNIFKEALDKLGVPLREAVSADGRPQTTGERKHAAKQEAGSDYKVESVFPNLVDALPDLKNIPAIWYKNWQKYHGSTLRSLVEAALTLAIPVSLEYQGEKLEVMFEKHVQHNGQTAVIAKEMNRRHTIVLPEIGRIKLLIPKGSPFE